jgi:hypothetical protein
LSVSKTIRCNDSEWRRKYMRARYLGLLMTVAIAVAAVDAGTSLAMAQAPQIVRPPARIEGKPNLSGIWQANNEANWDLQAHAARPAAVTVRTRRCRSTKRATSPTTGSTVTGSNRTSSIS